MKITCTRSAIAVAMAAIISSGGVWAQDTTTTNTTVNMVKRLTLTKNLTITGTINTFGPITVGSSAVSVIRDSQSATNNNQVFNNDLPNEAIIDDDSFGGAGGNGNVGANVVAGDNNLQDNALALSVDGSENNDSLMDTEIFVRQRAAANITQNNSVTNTSIIGDNAFMSATGSIGVNVTTGNNNLQKNNVALAVGDGIIAEASVNSEQVVNGNSINYIANTGNMNTARINNSAFNGASGNIGVNVSAGTNNLQSNSLAMSMSGGS